MPPAMLVAVAALNPDGALVHEGAALPPLLCSTEPAGPLARKSVELDDVW